METVTPLCPVFGRCGGCAYQNLTYEQELRLKEQELRTLWEEYLPGGLAVLQPIVASPREYHYRHRLDLKLQRTKASGILMGFTPVGGRGILEIQECPIGMEAVSDFLPQLKEQAVAKLPARYRQASLVVRTGDDGRVFWGGIGRRSNQLNTGNYLWTEVMGRKIFYSLDTFFQANLSILPELFRSLYKLPVWKQRPRFLDLYGGVGLFSIGLMDQARESILIENCSPSVTLARYNFQHHGLPESNIVEGAVEDHLHRFLDEKQVTVAMIDPPRAGLSQQALELFLRARHLSMVLYLSCHPQSLVRDLLAFTGQGWTITRVTPFDFFPKTKHLETLVILEPGENTGF